MGFFNKSASVGSGVNAPTGLRIQRSLYGATIPVWYGRTKGQPLLIAAWNFTKQQASSGKKAGMASKKTGQQSYIYFEDVDFLLGYGSMEGITGAAFEQSYYWEADILFSFAGSGSQTFTVPTTATIGSQTVYLNLVVSVIIDTTINATINDYGSPTYPTPLVLTNFPTSHPLHNQQFIAPNAGHWQFSGEPYAVFNRHSADPSVDVHGTGNYTVHIRAAYNTNTWSVDLGANVTSVLSALQGTFEAQLGSAGLVDGGTQPQLADFSGLAILPAPLGAGATLHNYNLVCKGLYGLNKYGDCNPADVIADLICSGNAPGVTVWNHGLGMSSHTSFSRWGGILADEPNMTGSGTQTSGLTYLRNYCQAYGIYVSQVLDTQQTADQPLQELLEITNTAAVYDGFQLHLIPYCEISTVGDGLFYDAPSASGPVFTLTDDHYVTKPGESPVTIKRARPSDNYNSMKIDYTQRYSTAPPPFDTGIAPTYIPSNITLSDQGDIWQQGCLPAQSRTYRWLHDPTVVAKVGWALLKRHMLCERMSFHFKLSAQFALLMPMDIVLASEPSWAFSPFPVRITKITEGEDFSLDIEAEPFIYGANAPILPQFSGIPSGGSNGGGTGLDPGAVNPPIIFETLPGLSSTAEIWLRVSGNSVNYGGCGVWLSTDGGNNYARLGSMVGESSMGLTTGAAFPLFPDPDGADTLTVDLTESSGQMTSFSTAQRDNFESVCYIDGGGSVDIAGLTIVVPYELISYATANLTAANQYSLPPTIRRGVYQTPVTSHPSGSLFSFLEQGPTFKIPLNPLWVGTTLWFKFTAFNIFGAGEQLLSAAVAYPFVPFAPPGLQLPYVVAAMLNCQVNAFQVIVRHVFSKAITFYANMVPSQAWVDTPPSSAQTFSIQKFTQASPTVGTTFATVTFFPGNTAGQFVGTAMDFAIGDVLEIIGPATVGDGAGMAFSLVGSQVLNAPIQSFGLVPPSSSIAVGTDLPVVVRATLIDGTTQDLTNQAVFSSSSASATINGQGSFLVNIHGVSNGNATVTANIGSLTVAGSYRIGTGTGATEDLLNWVSMDSRKATQHLGSSGVSVYSYLDAPNNQFWWLKSSTGHPWDIRPYDATNIYWWITENGSANFTNPNAYKKYVNPVPLMPRTFTHGTTVTIDTLGSNTVIPTLNCELDGLPPITIGSIRGKTYGPVSMDWHGDVGVQPTIIVEYYYSGSGGTYLDRERYFLVKDWGLVQWDHYKLSGSSYQFVQQSLFNVLSSPGSPAPDFPCGLPSYSLNPNAGVIT